MLQSYSYDQPHQNMHKEVILAFGDITVNYATAITLNTKYIYNRLIVVSSLDKDIKLECSNSDQTSEITIKAGKTYALDYTKINGTLKIKYSSAAPTTGDIQILIY